MGRDPMSGGRSRKRTEVKISRDILMRPESGMSLHALLILLRGKKTQYIGSITRENPQKI